MSRITGETITLTTRSRNGVDEGNNPVWQDDEPEQVGNVLIAPGDQSNAAGSIRPDGIQIAYTLYFPRSWPYRSLRGASIRIDQADYRVVGDPRPYRAGISPTRWNLVVQVQGGDG